MPLDRHAPPRCLFRNVIAGALSGYWFQFRGLSPSKRDTRLPGRPSLSYMEIESTRLNLDLDA